MHCHWNRGLRYGRGDKRCLVCSRGMLREVHACSLDLLLSDGKRREAHAFIQAFLYKLVKPKVWALLHSCSAVTPVQHVTGANPVGGGWGVQRNPCGDSFLAARPVFCVSGQSGGTFFVFSAVMCFWV